MYMERYIRNQLTSLFKDIIQQKCELEKQMIQNTLSLAAILPDESAYRIMKSPGYMAVRKGKTHHKVHPHRSITYENKHLSHRTTYYI